MNAIVVLKSSKLHSLRSRRPEAVELLADLDPVAYGEMVAADRQQRSANEQVAEALARCGLRAELVPRDQFAGPRDDTALIVVVGGDGTVLDAAKRIDRTPVLGINSDPQRSVGYFCATDAAGVEPVLRRWLASSVRLVELHRMSLRIDGKLLASPCLNDVLVTNKNPGMMSRYVITAGHRVEKHSSSGVWISTAAGSTAGIRSAGGTVLPLEGDLCQYLVREPFLGRQARYELLRGVRHLREGLSLRSQMEDGMIYMDGPFDTVPFALGSTLDISAGPRLVLVGMDPELRER